MVENRFHFFTQGAIGEKSEVWMYRQLQGLAKLNPFLICRSHVNQATFPIQNIPSKFFIDCRRYSIDHLLTSLKRRLLAPKEYGIVSRTLESWIKNRIEIDRPACVLFHYGTTAAKFGKFYSRKKIPVIVHFNGYDLSRMTTSRGYMEAVRLLARFGATFVVVAEYMREILLGLGATDDQINKIPYGVPLSHFNQSSNTCGPSCRFLMTGRLVDKKAPLISLKAFKLCHQSNKDSTLTVIGDGPLLARCREFVSASNLDHCVKFTGALLPEQVRQHMADASVFIQHSVTAENGDKEGWPVAIAEAAATGLPIVSTNHASIPEQVLDAKSGFIVPEGDVENMAKRMLELANSPELRARMGATARNHISQWDQPKQIEALGNVISRFLLRTGHD